MAEIEISKANTIRMQQHATELEKSIKLSYQYCLALKSMVNSASWKGEARDQFLTYIELIEQYHEEIKEVIPLQTEALKNIEKYRNDFSKHISVKAVNEL